jgi:2,4-dienoyl-CoA reductase-like NADH-dependent reductase (Old Yellow Enzyme family)/thioredoxin reductase
MSDLDVLWHPIRIGAVTARNRVYLPAHGMGLAGDQYGAYLRARALGGVGLIVAHGMPVHPSTGAPGGPEPWTRSWIPQIAKVIAPPHAAGCPILVQLAHLGPSAVRRTDELWGALWAPSAIPSPVHRIIPKAMEQAEIDELIEGFVVTAAHVQEAGGDGVELHAAHGYLLGAFLSPYWNRRTDEYGGDIARRARLILQIGAGIRGRCGAHFVVGLKMNVEEYIGASGVTPPDAMQMLEHCHRSGSFDYFTMAHTDYHHNHRLIPPSSSRVDAPPLAAAARSARSAVRGEVPILMAGSVNDMAAAAEVVRCGAADLVGLARPHIADPEIVLKTRAGRQDEIRRCVGANQGCWRRRLWGLPVICTANPAVGREDTWGAAALRPAPVQRALLVIGGGPAGLKFAETAALRGHRVTLWEAAERLGGQVRYAAALPDYGHWNRLVEDLEKSVKRLGVDVHLNTTATAERIAAAAAETIVIATGSEWDTSGFSTFRPDRQAIGRTEGSHVLDPLSAIAEPARCGANVVIVDDNGDYLPLGLARLLAALGRKVTVVTHDDTVGHRLKPTLELAWIYPRLVQEGIEIVTSSFIEHVAPHRVELSHSWSDRRTGLAADTLILSMMRRSADGLLKELRGGRDTVIPIGDCVAPREVDDAVFEGFRAALDIA